MLRSPRVLGLGLGLALVALAPALAADERAKAYAVGDLVADVTAKDMDGKEFSLATARALTPEKALEAVQAAAKTAGAKEPKPEDAIDALPGLAGEGGVDAGKRLAFVRGLGAEHGLIPGETAAAKLKTLADAAKWLADSAAAPIVFMCWKEACPTTKMYEERIQALFGEGTARLYVLAVNPKEDDATIKGHVAGNELGWRVLDDRTVAITARLGGRKTPHMFVLDAKNYLRYSGAIDDQFHGKSKSPEEAVPYLASALEAVAKGTAPWVQVTEPVG